MDNPSTTLVATPLYHANSEVASLESAVQRHLVTQIPMCVWSPPGCGKTEHIKQIIESAGFIFLDWRLAQMDQCDVRGIPYILDGRTYYAPPADLPAIGCAPTVLFLDELMQAHPSVVAVAGQVINERRIGGYTLPDNVVVMAATNRPFDRAAANRMPGHTAGRFLHYELVVRPTDWCDWAVANNVDDRVVAYLRFRPDQCYKYDPKASTPAYPSLRTWTRLATMIDGLGNDNPMLSTYARAAIGDATGGEFAAFITALERLPDIDAIIADPDAHDDPVEPDLRFAVSAALARRCDEDNVENVWQYMLKLDDEYQCLWAKDVIAIGDFDITQHEVFTEIVSLHQTILTS